MIRGRWGSLAAPFARTIASLIARHCPGAARPPVAAAPGPV